MRKIQTLVLIIILTFAMLISSCSSASSLRVGWACFNGSQKMDCSYRVFSGREVSQERFEAGESVIVNYDLSLESGSLIFTIENPAGEVIFTASPVDPIEHSHTFTAEQDGRYSFVVEGEEAEGAFLIEWQRSS
jgi:hypothetical protein